MHAFSAHYALHARPAFITPGRLHARHALHAGKLMDIRFACIARNARTTYAQVEIFPHLQDPIYTQDPTHHSSHTSLPDEHCSARKTPPFVERGPFTQTLHAALAMHAPDANSGTRGAAKATYRPLRLRQQRINQFEPRNESINRSLDRSIEREVLENTDIRVHRPVRAG